MKKFIFLLFLAITACSFGQNRIVRQQELRDTTDNIRASISLKANVTNPSFTGDSLKMTTGTAKIVIKPDDNYGLQISRPNDDVGIKIKVNDQKTGWIVFINEDGSSIGEIEFDTDGTTETFEIGSNEYPIILRSGGNNTVNITDTNMVVLGYITADSVLVGGQVLLKANFHTTLDELASPEVTDKVIIDDGGVLKYTLLEDLPISSATSAYADGHLGGETLSLSELRTGDVPMYSRATSSFSNAWVYTTDQVDAKEGDILTTVNQTYVSKIEYETLVSRVSALEDSITALSSRIGFITPTFPDAPAYLSAVGRSTDILVNWMDFQMTASPDSFELSIFTTDPSAGGDPPSSSVYTTDTFYVHTGTPTNTPYWYYVRAWLDNEFSNISNIDSAFVYEAPTVANAKYVSQSGNGEKTGVDSANAFAVNAISGIEAGDVLYFLGGTYTTAPTINFNGTATDLITLQSSYKYGATFTGLPIAFDINDDYLVFKHFKIDGCGTAFYVRAGSNVTYIDSCIITGGGSQGSFLFANGTTGTVTSIDSLFLRDNSATIDSQTSNQTDVIYIQNAGNLFIDGNTIIQANLLSTAHVDGIQTANYLGKTVIANNYVRNWNTVFAHGMMLNSPIDGDTLMVYNNNVIASTTGSTTSSPVISDYQWQTGDRDGISIFINNTLVQQGAANSNFTLSADNLNSTVKNNILYNANYGSFCYLAFNLPRTGTSFGNFDYNVHRGISSSYFAYTGHERTYPVSYTLANWLSTFAGSDNSEFGITTNYPDFVSATFSTSDLSINVTSPAYQTGTASVKSLIESFGLEWKTRTGGVRSVTTPNIGSE